MITELPPGEQALWTGAPGRYPLFDRQDAVLVPFSILWCGFAVFWEVSVVRMGAGWFFALWGLAFVVLGLYFTVGRLVVRQIMLRKVVYIVTNRRVIIRAGARQEQSRYLDQLEPPTVTEEGDGIGTIRFGSTSALEFLSRRGGWPKEPFVLRAIPQARSVRDLILTARNP